MTRLSKIVNWGVLAASLLTLAQTNQNDYIVVSSPGLAVQDHINLVKSMRQGESYQDFHKRVVIPWLSTPTFIRATENSQEVLIDSRLRDVKKYLLRKVLIEELGRIGINKPIPFSSLSKNAQTAFLDSEAMSSAQTNDCVIFLTAGAQVLIPSKSSTPIPFPLSLPKEFMSWRQQCLDHPFNATETPAIEDGMIHLSVSKFAGKTVSCNPKEAATAMAIYDSVIERAKGEAVVAYENVFKQVKSSLPEKLSESISSQTFKISDFAKTYFKMDDERYWKSKAAELGFNDPEDLKSILDDKSRTRIEWTLSVHYGMRTKSGVVKTSRLVAPSSTFGLPKSN